MIMSERPPALAVEDEEVRRRTVQEQFGVPLDRCRDLLWAALGDDSWRVRKEAVEVRKGRFSLVEAPSPPGFIQAESLLVEEVESKATTMLFCQHGKPLDFFLG